MGRQQGSICGLFLWLSVCKTLRARTHNTGSFYPGPPRSMGRMTFALCCQLGPWCHAIYPVLHLKGRNRKARQSPTPSSHWATEKTAWNASSANVSTWNRINSPQNTPSQTVEDRRCSKWDACWLNALCCNDNCRLLLIHYLNACLLTLTKVLLADSDEPYHFWSVVLHWSMAIEIKHGAAETLGQEKRETLSLFLSERSSL